MLYEFLKEKFNFHNEEYQMITTMGIGAASTFAHDFFIAPSDVVKQRMQLCKKLTARKCVRDIL